MKPTKDKLTIADLRDFITHIREHLPRTVWREALSWRVLKALLGDEWFSSHFISGGKDLTSFRQIAYDLGSARDNFAYQRRVESFAEMLFNFQEIEGFAQRITKLLSEDLEPAIAELQGAKMLYQSRVPFRFIEPKGELGLDYDVEATLYGGVVACCEMKCKVKGTLLSENTILNSLKGAKRQLPSDTQNIIFVKLPEDWIRQEGVSEVIDGALNNFFRASSRVLWVVLHWEEVHLLSQEGPAVIVVKVREKRNLKSTILHPRISTLLTPLNEKGNYWFYFASLLPQSPIIRPNWGDT